MSARSGMLHARDSAQGTQLRHDQEVIPVPVSGSSAAIKREACHTSVCQRGSKAGAINRAGMFLRGRRPAESHGPLHGR